MSITASLCWNNRNSFRIQLHVYLEVESVGGGFAKTVMPESSQETDRKFRGLSGHPVPKPLEWNWVTQGKEFSLYRQVTKLKRALIYALSYRYCYCDFLILLVKFDKQVSVCTVNFDCRHLNPTLGYFMIMTPDRSYQAHSTGCQHTEVPPTHCFCPWGGASQKKAVWKGSRSVNTYVFSVLVSNTAQEPIWFFPTLCRLQQASRQT